MNDKMPELSKTPVAAWRRKAAMAGYLFLLPNMLGFFVFTSLPVVASLVLSTCEWNLINPPKWAGLANFQKLVADADFWKFVGNTVFLMLGIPVGIFLSLFLAVILNQKLRGMVFFRTLLFLPSITAGIGTMLLWMWIFNPEFGALNTFLGSIYDVLAWLPRFLGWNWSAWSDIRPGWLTNPHWSKPSLILMGLWASMGGFNMILYLAALQGVSPELYEAAKMDGANAWQ
ncbi:MAG: sugar ABC transporter permease, partial [Verrucomicrobiota bacterium]|nr:sugar ABC transporter permease [Verrucomicrobiota bacterium]